MQYLQDGLVGVDGSRSPFLGLAPSSAVSQAEEDLTCERLMEALFLAVALRGSGVDCLPASESPAEPVKLQSAGPHP